LGVDVALLKDMFPSSSFFFHSPLFLFLFSTN